MNARLLFIAAAVFFGGFSGVGWAIENRFGPATVPPSSIRSGLVRSPNPLDTSGNLVMTGNIGGGRHFRGVVPYGARSEFGAVVGSSSLDSFLRRSAGSGDFGRYLYTGEPTPYYSQTRTVTTTRSGQAGVVGRRTTRIVGRADERVALSSLSKKEALLLRGLSFVQDRQSYNNLGLGRITLQEMEKAILADVALLQVETQSRRFTDAVLQQARLKERSKELLQSEVAIKEVGKGSLFAEDGKMRSEPERFGQELKQILLEAEHQREGSYLRQRFLTGQRKEEAAEPRPFEKPADLDESLWLRSSERARTDTPELWDRKRDKGRLGTELIPAESGTGEIALREEGKLDGFRPDYATGDRTGTLPNAKRQVWSLDVYEQMKRRVDGFHEVSDNRYAVGRESTSEIPGRSNAQRAKAILGSHETLARFSEDKFNQHLRAAEGHLKEGMYYWAADVYTLASVYKPENPLAYGGKSHALFAAGEYMSSALFLSRALGNLAEYEKKLKAKNKELRTVNSLALLASGLALIDRDKLESRVVDVEQWQQKSNSAELQFLLGYIYYQMGKLERAKEAVDEAYEKMPEAAAVIVLKKAIDSEHRNFDVGANSGAEPLNRPGNRNPSRDK